MSNADLDRMEKIDEAVMTASLSMPLVQRVGLLAFWQMFARLLYSLIDRIEKLEKDKSP